MQVTHGKESQSITTYRWYGAISKRCLKPHHKTLRADKHVHQCGRLQSYPHKNSVTSLYTSEKTSLLTIDPQENLDKEVKNFCFENLNCGEEENQKSHKNMEKLASIIN